MSNSAVSIFHCDLDNGIFKHFSQGVQIFSRNRPHFEWEYIFSPLNWNGFSENE